jgi:hypothetical protein
VSERAVMWQNFLYSKPLGTVVIDEAGRVWQKLGNTVWQRVGAAGDYSPESIPWPVSTLMDGTG